MNGILSRFFNFFFKGEIKTSLRTIEVFEAEIERSPKLDESTKLDQSIQKAPEENVKTNQSDSYIIVTSVIVNINRTLTFICVGSLIAMTIYSFVYPGQPMPDTLQSAFYTTLGWLGSAFANFFQIDKKMRS